jgi:hypothetical protein
MAKQKQTKPKAQVRQKIKPNRKYKSGVFEMLCDNNPEKAVEMFNALTGANYPPDTPVEFVTLKNPLFMSRVNDLAFVIDGRVVVLIEHQSTLNENMPLRLLIYIGRIYEMFVGGGEEVYRKSRISLPVPEFMVLYNGKDECPDESTMRLSEAFGEIPPEFNGRIPLELEVQVYNINEGRNTERLSKCENLSGYAHLIEKTRKFEESGIELSEALALSVRECIEEGVLTDFLKRHGSEVINMFTEEWNMDKALEVRFKEGEARGEAKGVAKGVAIGKRETWADAAETFAKEFGIPLEAARAVAESRMNIAHQV